MTTCTQKAGRTQRNAKTNKSLVRPHKLGFHYLFISAEGTKCLPHSLPCSNTCLRKGYATLLSSLEVTVDVFSWLQFAVIPVDVSRSYILDHTGVMGFSVKDHICHRINIKGFP